MCCEKRSLENLKEVRCVEDFIKVFKVFRDYPYNELWPEEEIRQEYERLSSIGKVIGYYTEDEECIGIITFYDIIKDEHPVHYTNEKKVLYFSDVAVLPEYRNKGIATKLLKYMIKYAENNAYDIIYMRTMQPNKSMSYHMVVKNGFKVMQGISEAKKMSRTNGKIEIDDRIFLEYHL